MDKRFPSDVFLELWRAREIKTPEAFRECAEAWAQIRELERAARDREFFRGMIGPCSFGGIIRDDMAGGASPSPTSPPESAQTSPLPPAAPAPPPAGEAAAESTPKSTPDEGEKVHPERVESTPAEGVQNGPPARDNSDIGKKAYAARKANMRETLDRVRASGVSMQSIADASGLSLNDVLDFLAARPLPLPKLAKLGKGLGKLEEAEKDEA